jgi:DNA polymerase III alpha subunit (gram-positive type)
LTKEFAKDEKAKYADKPIVVEGKVVAVEAKPDKAATITLAGHNETDKEPIRVTCYFPEDLAEKVKKVEKGATVKVKGELGAGSSLLLKTIDLHKCSLVE